MRDAVEIGHDCHGRSQPDLVIARLAARQHGVVSRAQLLELRLGRGAIDHRVARKRLHPLHHGTYALAPGALSEEARWMAAVLAAGARAVLSHWSAAHLWRLLPGGGPTTHVTSPVRGKRRAGVTLHAAELPSDEVTVRRGIPVTAPGRVILDLAPHAAISSLHQLLANAERVRPWPGPSIPELLKRYPRRAGTPKLRAAAAQPRVMLRSELEARFLHLLGEWGFPRPQLNVAIDGCECDCVWHEERLVVELDGFATHATRFAFERDRERDRKLQAAGWTVIRITWRQLAEDPAAIRRDLARLLT